MTSVKLINHSSSTADWNYYVILKFSSSYPALSKHYKYTSYSSNSLIKIDIIVVSILCVSYRSTAVQKKNHLRQCQHELVPGHQ